MIHNEASDEALEIVAKIEPLLQFSYAPDGSACFTWRCEQDIGLLLDEALAKARETGRKRAEALSDLAASDAEML